MKKHDIDCNPHPETESPNEAKRILPRSIPRRTHSPATGLARSPRRLTSHRSYGKYPLTHPSTKNELPYQNRSSTASQTKRQEARAQIGRRDATHLGLRPAARSNNVARILRRI